MARYDTGWGGRARAFPRSSGYDRPFGGGRAMGVGQQRAAGYDRGLRGYDRGYGRGFAPGGLEDELDSAGIYGPGRYGLGPYHERLRERRRPDDELRKEVEEALFYDTWVDAEAIAVEVEDGIVTLSGTLPNYEEVRYATDDAWDVDGVIGVRSDLKVDEG